MTDLGAVHGLSTLFLHVAAHYKYSDYIIIQ